MRSHMGTGTHHSASRTRREDLTVQVELSTVIASDYSQREPSSYIATNSKDRDAKAGREALSFGYVGELSADEEVLSPTMDKAERGALAHSDVDTQAGAGEPPLSPPRPIAFELTSPISPLSQSMQQRREQAAHVQAEEEEFMRII